MSFTMGPLKLLRLCFIIAMCPPAVAAFQEPLGEFSVRHFSEDDYRSPVGSDGNGFPYDTSLSSWQNAGPESPASPTEVPRIQVSCTGSRLTLLVEKRFNGVLLSGEDLQLGDDCFHNGYSKENFVFTYDFAQCGTNHVVTQNGLDVFYNLLHFIPRSPALTWWQAPFTVPVSCVPNRSHNGATDFAFSVPLPSTSNDWSFTINAMNPSWTSTAESNLYQRGQSIHLQVSAKCGTEQRPFIQSCWLSKSIAPETRPRHAVILNKGCTVTSRSNHTVAQFVPSGRKDAINFILDTSRLKSEVYIHCSVVISDKGITVGFKSCNYKKLRSRWEELTDNAMVCNCCRSKCKDHTRGISHIDAMALVSTGPFIVNGEPVRSRPPAPQPRVLSHPPAPQPKVLSHPPASQPRVLSNPPASQPRVLSSPPASRVLSNPPASQPRVLSNPPAPQPRVLSPPPPPEADYVYDDDEPAPEVNKYDAATSQSASGAQEGTISSENAIPGPHWLPVSAGASFSSQAGPAAILSLTLPGQIKVTHNNAPSTNDVAKRNPTAPHHPFQSPLKGLGGKRFNAIGSDAVTTGVPLTAEGFLIPLLDGWPIPPPPMLYGWPIPPPYHEVAARREEGLRRREEALRAIREESQRKRALQEREAFLREEAIRNREWGGLSMRHGQALKEHNAPWPALVSTGPYIVNGEPVRSRPPAPQPWVLSHAPAPQPRGISHPPAPDADFYLDIMLSDEPAPDVTKYDASTTFQSASGAQEGTISSENAIPGPLWLPEQVDALILSQEGPAAILSLTLPSGQVQVTQNNAPSTNDVAKRNPTAPHHPLQSPLKGLSGKRFNAIGSDAVTSGVPLTAEGFLIPLLDGWPIPPPPMLYGWPIPPPYHEVAARQEEGLRRREEALREIREESQRKRALWERKAFLREEAIRNREWGGLSMRRGQALKEHNAPWPAYDLNHRGSSLDLNMGGQQADNEVGTTADGQPILRSRLQFETDADGSQALSYEEETVKAGDGNRRTRTLGKDEDVVEKRTATGQRRLLSKFLNLLRKLDQRE